MTHREREYEIAQEQERARRTIQSVGCAAARGIWRHSKHRNRHQKAAQHAANLALRRDMNREAHMRPGTNPRPYPGMRA